MGNPDMRGYTPPEEDIQKKEQKALILETKGEKTEKIKQFFGHCFEIQRIEEGDQIPVGGENILSDEVNIKVSADFENFKQIFTEAHELANKQNFPKLKEYLNSQGMEIDEKLFASLYAFTKKIEEKYPDNYKKAETRRKLYVEKNKEIKLSDVFGSNSAECAEIAILAQGYLQQEDISSTYFSGEVLWDRDSEYSEAHSFIIIRQGDKVYIYDPANPTNTVDGKNPSIYATETKFDEEIAKGQKKFVTSKNLLTKKEAYYGVSNGTNVIPEKHIV